MSGNLGPRETKCLEDGQAVQIVSINDGKFMLNDSNLSRILLDPSLKNKKIYVVSIVGSFRTGKSFFLSSFLNYIQSKKLENVTNRSGFKWSYGSNPHTKGIWMWNRPFDHRLENGENVIIYL
jgi:atlastin